VEDAGKAGVEGEFGTGAEDECSDGWIDVAGGGSLEVPAI
jgi:hypothetical protein